LDRSVLAVVVVGPVSAGCCRAWTGQC